MTKLVKIILSGIFGSSCGYVIAQGVLKKIPELLPIGLIIFISGIYLANFGNEFERC
jgi:hypothetical protein